MDLAVASMLWELILFLIDDPFSSYLPLVGVRTQIGNKSESFALCLNIGIFPSVGFYYRNIFINIGGINLSAPSHGESYFYLIDFGYSFDL